MTDSLRARLTVEFIGTALLLATVIGSGIMGERLFGNAAGLTLLVNTLATGAALVALILAFGPASGAHFNPAVTLAEAFLGGRSWGEALCYIAAQFAGGFLGVIAANAMFGLPGVFLSQHVRSGRAQLLSEFVATFGLLAVIQGCARVRSTFSAFAVGAYVTAGYWFTASTCFANPAVTLARSISNTFAGIRPADVPAFIAAQLLGAAAATAISVWISPRREKPAH